MRDYFVEYDEDFGIDDFPDTMEESLGNGLYNGILVELPKVVQDDDWDEGTNLKACLAYLYLEGIIQPEALGDIMEEIHYYRGKSALVKVALEKVSGKILFQLQKSYEFRSLDELVEKLNEKKLPGWSFPVGEALPHKYTSGLILCDRQLYYIAETMGKKLFCKLDIYHSVYDPITDLDTLSEKLVLGYGYHKIYAYDRSLKRFYLEPVNQEGFYHCYDVLTNSFSINKGKFVALKNGFPYIITEDDYFARVENETVNKLKKWNENEAYCECEKYFLVRPADRNKSFFYPYAVGFDGKVMEADKKECRKIIWDRIQQVVCDDEEMIFDYFSPKKNESKKVPMPNTLSIINVLQEVVRASTDSSLCDNKRFLLFKDILSILSPMVGAKKDITKLWYVLYDIDRSMKENIHGFPSEEFYWRLKELVMTEEKKVHLKNTLKSEDYGTLRKLFGVSPAIEVKSDKHKGKIGVFSLCEDELEANIMPISSGKVFGTHIVPNVWAKKDEGVVTYDSVQGHFYITFHRVLQSGEKLMVLRRFEIPMNQITFFVQAS